MRNNQLEKAKSHVEGSTSFTNLWHCSECIPIYEKKINFYAELLAFSRLTAIDKKKWSIELQWIEAEIGICRVRKMRVHSSPFMLNYNRIGIEEKCREDMRARERNWLVANRTLALSTCNELVANCPFQTPVRTLCSYQKISAEANDHICIVQNIRDIRLERRKDPLDEQVLPQRAHEQYENKRYTFVSSSIDELRHSWNSCILIPEQERAETKHTNSTETHWRCSILLIAIKCSPLVHWVALPGDLVHNRWTWFEPIADKSHWM